MGGGRERVIWGLQAKYLVLCCCNRDSLRFVMQHDHVLKKRNFDQLTPSRGRVCALCVCVWGGGGGGVGLHHRDRDD